MNFILTLILIACTPLNTTSYTPYDTMDTSLDVDHDILKAEDAFIEWIKSRTLSDRTVVLAPTCQNQEEFGCYECSGLAIIDEREGAFSAYCTTEECRLFQTSCEELMD